MVGLSPPHVLQQAGLSGTRFSSIVRCSAGGESAMRRMEITMARNLPASPALSPRHDPMRLFVSTDLWRAAALLLSSFVAGTVWFAVLMSLLMLGLFESVI